MKIDFNIKEILTLPILIYTALSLGSGMILFFPTGILKLLFMLEFRQKYGFIIGLVFVLSVSILIVNLIYKISNYILKIKAEKNFYATAEDRLKKLNNYQKAIIYTLFIQENRTFLLPLHDGAVTELEQKYMIGKATTQYMISDLNNASFPYLLQPWVSDELNNKPNLLSDFLTAFELQCEKEYNLKKENNNFW